MNYQNCDDVLLLYSGFQMSDDMSRRIRLGAEQKRLSDAERLCGSNTVHCPEFLKQVDFYTFFF